MSTEVKNFSFPLFSYVVDVKKEQDGHYLCLHKEEKSEDGQFCGRIRETFDKTIEHWVLYHSCPLKKEGIIVTNATQFLTQNIQPSFIDLLTFWNIKKMSY